MKRIAAIAAMLLGCVACQSPPAPPAPAASAGAAVVAASPSPSPSPSASATGRVRVVPAAQDMDALSQIRTARLEAKAEGRVLVVYVAASWCEPCKKMKEEIQAGRLDARLPKVTLLAFDADKDQERLATVGYTFHYIPYVALPGPDGQPVDSLEARGKGSGAWRELVAKLEGWQP